MYLVYGVNYAFGVFLGEFMETFGTEHATASMVQSTQMGLMLVTGPLAAYLVGQFSCRGVAIVGSILAACGLMISSIVPSIASLFITAGIVTGNNTVFCLTPKCNVLHHHRYWIWSHVPTLCCNCDKIL